MNIFASLLIAVSFLSIIPVHTPEWNSRNLRFFVVMIPIAGLIFSALWLAFWFMLSQLVMLSPLLRGFLMMLLTLTLTGGLHTDGLMDTCDALFSHRDRETRIRILSDTHAGSFAVMGCVTLFMAKTLLFAELLTLNVSGLTLALIPACSRLGLSFILNNLPFAKNDGLAVMLGASRVRRDNWVLVMMTLAAGMFSTLAVMVMIACVFVWSRVCIKLFGGITGDLLGAFVELSEVIMLISCIS